MRTLISKKWKFVGVLEGKLRFDSRIYEDEVLLCGAPCKFVDSTSGGVAIINLSGTCGYEAEWTNSTKMRKTKQENVDVNTFILQQLQ